MASFLGKLARATPGRLWSHWKFLKRQKALQDHSLDVARKLRGQENGLVVLSGPFAGMRAIDKAAGSALLPKLVGSYECELHPAIARLTARGHRLIVDVGCAEGYYAVGLARLFPRARVRAHDIDSAARRLCMAMAELNEVSDRVAVGGYFKTGDLATIRDLPALIVSDCEGYEATFLDPKAAPALSECDVLVEIHEHIVPGVGELLDGRFAATHDIEKIPVQCRWPADWADYTEGLSPEDQAFAVNEYRQPGTSWRLYTSRA
jgi:hypothetical protein